MKKRSTVDDYQIRVVKAYRLISRMIDRPIDIALLARESAFSLYHFHRIYRGIVGETVTETHRRLRLERAAKGIANTRLSITEIALDAGYETPQAFSRAFKARFKCSPTSYRKKERRNEEFNNLLPRKLGHFSKYMESFKMNVTIEKREKTIVYGMRHVGRYMEVGKVFQEVFQWACTSGLAPQIKCGICIYYDDPSVVPDEKCRADACVELSLPYPEETDKVKRHEIPAGTYACYRHVGSYSKLEEAYAAFCGGWFPANDYEPANSPSFEIYHNDPADTPEDELITDIYIQIADK